ncbi:protein kinase family protein [Mobilicoccus massiliensis]|uniref:protein kinase family protein n=1 Tax=Mobilicoccus massiliensis TaxID=1522310 RepID=UPI00058C6E9E|nr:protein kinase family protein [Mobilicoccus massiliensis]
MQGVGTGRLIASRYALRQRRATLGNIEVWAATDSTLGREVSVTVLPVSDSHAEPLLEAARRTAAVNDHRLVRVLDVGSRGEIAWVVEESLSESTSVADLLVEGPLPPEEARRIAGEVASALDVAARAGLHHLHVTPHAVRRTKAGLIKIAGLATAAAVEGTSVPDDGEAQRIDALGTVALLYAAMTTRWPLRTPVPGLEAAPRVGGSVVPPSEIAVAVPPDLDDLCRDAFARSAAPRTPEELAQRLGPWSHTLVRHVAPKATATSAPTELIPRVRPGQAGAAAAAGTTGARAAAGASGAAAQNRQAPAARPPRPPRPKPSHREQRAHERAAQAAEARREIAARRRDPGFFDVPEALDSSTGPLEPPAPLVAAPLEREGRYAKIVLGIVAAIILIATLVAARSLFGAVEDMTNAVTPTPTRTPAPTGSTPGNTSSPSSTSSASESTSAASAIAFEGARALDPEGDGRENNGGVPKAYDGDTGSYWQSEGYKQPDFQGQKAGVGIAFELPQEAEPAKVSVVLGERPQDAKVFVSDTRSVENATETGSFSDASGAQEFDVPEDARPNARYVIVWVTKAMEDTDGKYRAVISEVTAL